MKASEIPRLRLYNSGLSDPRFKSATDAVSYLGAVQAQDFAAAKWLWGFVSKIQPMKTLKRLSIVERSELQSFGEEIEKLKSEKAEMIDTYHETVTEHIDEKSATEKDFVKQLEDQRKEVNQRYDLVKALTANTKIDSPIAKEDKRRLQDW